MRLVTIFRLPFAIAILVALGAAVGGYWIVAALAVLAAAAVYVFGRDPHREFESHPLGIVSPVDGWVEEIRVDHDPYLDREAVVAKIRQGLFSPTIVRSTLQRGVSSMPNSFSTA